MSSQPGWMKKTASVLALTLTANSAFANGAVFPDSSKYIDVNKKFAMQVPLTPYTNPNNPAFRVVNVDCGKLGAMPDGKVAITGVFVDQFDLPPLRSTGAPKSGTIEEQRQYQMREGSAALVHLGSLSGPNQNHQLCVAQAETISGEAKRKGGTSVPANDDRYCPPFAAMKMCMKDTAAQKNMSPVWKWDQQTNTLEFTPN